MANVHQKRSENAEGDFYVDTTCIDCDTCRWMAPEVFRESGGQSAVFSQPQSLEQRKKAFEALVSCPTASIGTANKDPLLKEVTASFPIPVAENVFHSGYHAEGSYGAASYFIQREEGNVLIDSPRFAAPLVKKLDSLGGVKYLYLTHRDDVADHELFQKHFGCQRILHRADIDRGTSAVEIPIEGEEAREIEKDLLVIPVPGHTQGHSVLLYKNKFLFTGDHLAYSERLKQLYAFYGACWYSWPAQVRSMEKLLNHSFEWILPGHGRRFYVEAPRMKSELKKCVDWMKSKGDKDV